MASLLHVSDVDMQDLDGRYRLALNAFFRRRCGNHSEAEDLTQEVFMRLIGRNQSVPIGHLDSYIFQVAANILKDQARRAQVRKAQFHVEYPLGERETFGDGAMVDALDPHRIMESRQALSHSLAALSELQERTRDIFILSRVEKLKHREIADLLGISVSAVEKHLVRAVTHLAKRKRAL